MAIEWHKGRDYNKSFCTATPLPAALPLFATGLAMTGLLGSAQKAESCGCSLRRLLVGTQGAAPPPA